MTILGSDNKYAGGLTYSSPAFTMGGGGASVNGGLSFDLPLATIAAFSDQALSFASGNSANNRGFLSEQLQRSTASADAGNKRTFDFLNLGLNSIVTNNRETMSALERVNASTQLNSNFRLIAQPKPAKGGSKCFITTAICELDGKPDNCYELTLLRKFRDEFMLPNSTMAQMVSEYYRVAPSIVDRIKSQPDGGRAMLTMLERQYLLPAIAHIEAGKHDDALVIYTAMVTMAESLLTNAGS